MNAPWQALSGPFGARCDGRSVDSLATPAILDALHRHQLLVFPEQQLDAAGLEALGRRLGTLARYPFAAALPGYEYVVPIVKEADESANFGGDWHTDTSYLQQPPSATLLLARELPESGGDTLFADAYGAYEQLSDGLKATLEMLCGINTSSLVHDPNGEYAEVSGDRAGLEADTSTAVHPVVRKHPVTGKPALYVSLIHTQRFVGMTRPESLPLLEFLQQQLIRAENCVRLQWQPGTLAIWDNRCLQHLPLNDYGGQRRSMLRVILQGESPEPFVQHPLT